MNIPQIRSLKPKLKKFLKRFDDCFPRKDTRAHLPTYISGQLSDIPEKSVEPIALNAGVAPRTLQEFLSQHHWDHDLLRDQLQHIVRDEHAGPHSIGVIDETSDVKKGDKTPGVQRQWCGSRRQEGELPGHGPPGLRPRRLPLPDRRRVVPARELVGGSAALSRGRHPRRHGVPAQVADRPGAV